VTIGLLALAFAVVFLPTRVFHVAFGGLYTISPFITWYMLNLGLPWPATIAAAILVSVALSLGIEALNHSPLKKKGASLGIHLVSSLGLFIVLTQGTALLWGNDVRTLRTGMDQVFNIGNYLFTRTQILAGLIGSSLLLGFFVWLRWTKLGLQLRALSSNETEVALRGYNVRNLRLICFGISGALCACSSLLIAYDAGFSAQSGLSALLLAIVATIVGGKDSFLGPVIGGILVAVLRSEVSWIMSARWQDAATFLLLIIFLLIRPAGLFARRTRVEADQ
jgi:branched-chain amino acid transport system permease protein